MTSPRPLLLMDAHNHLQDDRFAGQREEVIAAAVQSGVARMVVNGSDESDWPQVADLVRQFPFVIPAFGCHPWYLRTRTPGWRETLETWLNRIPGAVMGEIGLDRWMIENPERWKGYFGGDPGDPPSIEEQEDAFVIQLRMAAARNVSASIHCLQAFGRLRDLLEANPRPARGFLLHSYGGPVELVPTFARLGAYFSFPGYYAHERKTRQRETFRQVPLDRLLIETDAPDQPLPDEWNRHPLRDPQSGRPLNHPANLAAVGEYLAGFLRIPVETLAERTSENFQRLFGP